MVPEGGMLLPGRTMILLNWRLRPGHFGLLMTLTQQSKKGAIVLVGMIDPDFQRELRLPVYNGCKEEYVWNKGDLLGFCLVLP